MRERERDPSSICRMTPQLATVATSGPVQNLEIDAMSKYPTWFEGTQVLGGLPLLPWHINRELARKQSSRDLTQQFDMQCPHGNWWLNVLWGNDGPWRGNRLTQCNFSRSECSDKQIWVPWVFAVRLILNWSIRIYLKVSFYENQCQGIISSTSTQAWSYTLSNCSSCRSTGTYKRKHFHITLILFSSDWT